MYCIYICIVYIYVYAVKIYYIMYVLYTIDLINICFMAKSSEHFFMTSSSSLPVPAAFRHRFHGAEDRQKQGPGRKKQNKCWEKKPVGTHLEI